MIEHNPWTKGTSTPPEPVDEEVEAERLPTLNELEGKPIADQLAALSGLTRGISHRGGDARLPGTRLNGIPTAAEDVGVDRPPDIVRSLGCCAYEVLRYNAFLAEQGHPDANGAPETRH